MWGGELDGGGSSLQVLCTVPSSPSHVVGTSRVSFQLLVVCKGSGTSRRSGQDFPPFALLRLGLVEGPARNPPVSDLSSNVLAAKKVVRGSFSFPGGRTSLTPHAVKPSSSALHKEVSSGFGVSSSSHMETVKRLVCKAGFSEEVADVISNDLRSSTAV